MLSQFKSERTMTMSSFVSNRRRSCGKLVLLTGLFVSLLHATSAAVKLGPQGALTGLGGPVTRRALTTTDSDDYDAVVAEAHTTSGLYDYGTRVSARHSGNGNGKGGKSALQVEQCYDSCYGTPSPSPSPTAQPTPQYNDKPEKPACCKGGVSSLKMLYQGSPQGEIFLSPDGYDLVDACDKTARVEARKHDNDGSIVQFVSCSECFFNGTIKTTCDFYNDSVQVETGDYVCLAVFDAESKELSPSSKMPTDLDLYFVENDGTNEAIQTTLHTSCSKPIYSPFAVRLDDCETDGYPFYIDVSIIDIDSMIQHPVLVFIDGTSAKSPSSLFSDCDATPNYNKDDNTCCKGGVSFLKIRVGGTTTAGSLTVNKTLASTTCDFDNDDDDSDSSSDSKSKSKGSTIRFVSCDDECLDPFSDAECGESSDSVQVLPDEDICFGSWDEETNRIAYGDKMATNVEMFFVPDNTDSFPVQSALLHTSCSKPVYPNWASVFAEDCDSTESTLVSLDDVTASSLGFHVAFIDGVSRGYYEAAFELIEETGVSFFDVSFADCGCNCNATAFPTTSPSPTASPVTNPPTPGRNPGPGPPDTATAPPTAEPTAGPQTCEEQCASYVLIHCNRTWDNGDLKDEPCDVTAIEDSEGGGDGEGEGRQGDRFLRSNVHMLRSVEHDVATYPKEEQVKWHDDMNTLYETLLALVVASGDDVE